MAEPRQAFALAYEALLHANHLVYELPRSQTLTELHLRMDRALNELQARAAEWGCNVNPITDGMLAAVSSQEGDA